MIYPCRGESYGNKKEPSTDTHDHSDGSQGSCAEGKSWSQEVTVYVPYVWHSWNNKLTKWTLAQESIAGSLAGGTAVCIDCRTPHRRRNCADPHSHTHTHTHESAQGKLVKLNKLCRLSQSHFSSFKIIPQLGKSGEGTRPPCRFYYSFLKIYDHFKIKFLFVVGGILVKKETGNPETMWRIHDRCASL